MNIVTIFHNAVDPEERITERVDDVCAFIKREFGDTFPDSARIYHESVDLQHDVTPHSEVEIERLQKLTGSFYVVVWPEDAITIAVVIAIALAAVAIGLAFLLRPNVPNQVSASPNNELGDRQNKARPNERIPDIYGTVRSTPDLIALPYKYFIDNLEYEYIFGCIGRGSYTIIDCKDDQTPINEIAGEYAAVYAPFTSPNDFSTPEATFGIPPSVIPPVVSISQSNAVNGQLVRAPNSGQFQSNNNVNFTYGGLITTNDSNVDFTEYFVASTLTVPSYLEIFANDDGLNASDPAQSVHSVGLQGVYQILDVTSNTITLSNPSAVNANWNILMTFSGEASTFYHTFMITTSGSTLAGPYVLNEANLTQVWGNFVAQNGLYVVDDNGNQHGLKVTIQMSVQAIDQTLTPFGDIVSGTVDVIGSSIDRITVGSTLKLVLPTPGPVQVTVARITPMGTDNRNQWCQDIQWRDLYAVADLNSLITPQPPVTPPDSVAWAYPTVNAAGSNGTYNGATSSDSGCALEMSSANSLGNLGATEAFATWTDFALPSGVTLPGGATITGIYPVILGYEFGRAGAPLWLVSGASINISNGVSITGTGLTWNPTLRQWSTLGSIGTSLTGLEVGAGLWGTVDNSPPSDPPLDYHFVATFVALAIYYTGAQVGEQPTEVPGSLNFGNVTTILAITAQTPDALSIRERKLNALVTRNLPTWNNRSGFALSGAGPATFGGSIPTNNAADIFCAMALDPYIGRRQAIELDVPGIYAVADSAYMGGGHEDGEIATYFGTFLMTEFCYTFDDSKMSFEESAAYLGQAINSIAYRSARTISLSFEKLTANSAMIFNHRNKLPNSEQRTVTFGMLNDNDSVQYQYIDPNAPNFPDLDTQLTLYFPVNQSGQNPKKVTSTGVRNLVQATINGWRMFQKIVFACIQTKFDATQEAALRIINDRVLIADNTRSDTQDGQVESQTGLVVTCSQDVVFQIGQTYTAYFQHYDDTVEAIAVTAGTDANQMVLAAAPSLPLVIDDDKWAKTTYIVVSDSSNMRPLPFLISDKEPQDNNTFTMTAINYSDAYYAHDQDVASALLLAPIAGYGPQGYTGSGLIKADGTTYTPAARGAFDNTTYPTSTVGYGNNPAPPVTTAPPGSTNPPTTNTKAIGISIDGGGFLPDSGAKGFVQVPFAGTIVGWTMLADGVGSAQVTVSKGILSAYPTVASIVASAPPAMTTLQSNSGTLLTGWTVAVNQGDIFSFNLDSISGAITRLVLELTVEVSE